jgi:hypothetical protein
MLERKTWNEFRGAGLLWFINMLLHVFGWAVVVVVEDDGSVSECYPARTKFRGFSDKDQAEGYLAISQWVADNASTLLEESK